MTCVHVYNVFCGWVVCQAGRQVQGGHHHQDSPLSRLKGTSASDSAICENSISVHVRHLVFAVVGAYVSFTIQSIAYANVHDAGNNASRVGRDNDGSGDLHVRVAWTIDALLPTPDIFEVQFGFRCVRTYIKMPD